jgi:hypothetical protein
MLRVIIVAAVITAVGTAVFAQTLDSKPKVSQFFNIEMVSVAANISSGETEWGKKNCPSHFAQNFWLSSLGSNYVAALRASNETLFDEQVANADLDLKDRMKEIEAVDKSYASEQRYEICKQLWVNFLTVEAVGSKAYWTAGWRP